MTTNEKLRELLHEAHSELLYLKVEVGFRRNTLAVIERIEAALADPVAEPARDWQAECLKKGFEYVRESDDHYVIASPAEMVALLRDLLGIDVRQKNGRDYGVAVCELQEQIDGLVNTLHSKLTDRPAQAGQQEPVAVLYADGTILSRADCGGTFDICCRAQTPLYLSPQPTPDTSDIEGMVAMLENREWAEHAGTTPLGKRLEAAITDLMNEVAATAALEAENKRLKRTIDTCADNELASLDERTRLIALNGGLVEALERVKLTESEARNHSVHNAAYWNNAVTACIDAAYRAQQEVKP